MISFNSHRSFSRSLALGLALAGTAFTAQAVTLSTVPVGFLRLTFPSGTTTAFGIPLDDTTVPSAGIRAGKIDSFTTTSLTSSVGNWSGNLADPAAPWSVRLTSGAAAGRVLDITANTATTLSVTGGDTTGVVAGDTFELISVDTLGTLFGSTTLQGGTSSANADVVQVRSGVTWVPFYYDTNLGYWRRTSGAATSANNFVIHPGSSLLVLRRGATLSLTFTGRVLGTTFRLPVNNASSTGLTTGYPMDTTLAGLGIQNLVAGWHTGTSTSTADAVGLYNGSTWVPYLYNGTNWQSTTGVNSDALSLPAGGALIIQRIGAASGTTELIRSQPY